MASGGHLGYGYLRSLQCKNNAELDSSYQQTSKMAYFTTFSDNYLEKLGFPRWHLVVSLDMVIRVTQNAKPLAEMDSSYQKTSKTTYCTTFCDNYLKIIFPRCRLVAILNLCKFRELPKVVILATKLDKF